MLAKFLFKSFETAILALNLDMRFSLVVFLVTLSYDHSALSTFVINLRTLDLVHAVLAYFDSALAILANFGFFLIHSNCFNHN
jgi:hypothetical protein